MISIKMELEADTVGALQEKLFLEISQNSKRVCFLIKLHSFIKKDTLAQVLSCEFFKISKNTFFIENLRVIPSVKYLACLKN